MQTERKKKRENDPEIKCCDPSAPSTGDAAHYSQEKLQRDLLGNVVTFSSVKSPPMLESDRQNEFAIVFHDIFNKGAPCIELKDPPPGNTFGFDH